MTRLTRGRDLDITGLSYELLDREGPQQWPFPAGATTGAARLYGDGRFHTPSGRARFFAERYRPVAEPADARYPLTLTTGRLRDQWHGMSRTGSIATLFGHAPEPRLSMNANDMARRGIEAGDLVRVESRRGALHVVAQADAAVRSGQAYLPMHWGKRYLGGRASAGVNTVTSPALDPLSHQPELKHAAIRVVAAPLAWRLTAFAELAPERLAPTLAALQPLNDELTFASSVAFGRERPGLLLRAANEAAPPAAWLAALDALLGLDADLVLRYDDPRRTHSRRILVTGDRLVAARLAGTPAAVAQGEWLRDWLARGDPVTAVRRYLLHPGQPGTDPLARLAEAGGGQSAPRGPTPVLCQCFGVSEGAVRAALAECAGTERERVEALKERLKCGTNCGSCLPELRQLAGRVPPKAGRMVA